MVRWAWAGLSPHARIAEFTLGFGLLATSLIRRLPALAPIGNWLSDALKSDRLSLAMLLAHLSGLPNPNPVDWVHLASEARGFDDRRALAAVVGRYRGSPAAGSYRYSNRGYWLAGAFVEQATDRTFATLVADRLMAPLGLTATDISMALPDGAVLARGHPSRFGPVYALLRLSL